MASTLITVAPTGAEHLKSHVPQLPTTLDERVAEAKACQSAGERQVGFVTTAARHHELGPVALALVKRSTPPDATLTAGGIPAAQEVVVAP